MNLVNKNFSDAHRSFKLSQQALILNDNYEILILHNAEKPDQWLFPGGRVDADETDLELALAREIKEELNLDLTEIVKMLWFDQSPGLSAYAVLFEVKVKNLDELKLSHEHSELRWIKPNDPELLELMFYKNLTKKVNEIYSAKKTVLFFGDSLTFCFDRKTHDRSIKSKRWTTMVENNFKDTFDFIVEGLGGRTLDLDDELEGRNGLKAFIQALHSHQYLDYIFVMLGTNELKERFRTDAETVTKKFFKYQDELIKFGNGIDIKKMPKIILIAPPKINEKYMPQGYTFFGGQKISDSLAGEYVKITKELNWDFIDASNIEVSEDDGVHLNEEGNRKLSELVSEYLRNKA